MAAKVDIVDILRSVVESLEFTYVIKSQSTAGDLITLNAKCSTYQLRKDKRITIDGNLYKITAIDINNSITVQGVGHNNPIVVDSFTIPAPKFFHGTIYLTNAEVTQIKKSNDKVPMIYYYETVREKDYRFTDNQNLKEVDARIFILDESNYKNSFASDFHVDVIQPLDNLQTEFLSALEKDQRIGILDEFERFTHSQFGWYDRNGHLKTLFSDHLTGIELRLTVPLTRQCLKCN